MMATNQRPDSRSYRTCGSDVLEPARTELKKLTVLRFNTPSWVPVVLLNETMRPFTPTRYCVGPTAPSQSGGNELVGLKPDSVAARKFGPIAWGPSGWSRSAWLPLYPVSMSGEIV